MKKIKVLLSKLGLDVHNRGILTIYKELIDANMDVIYTGNMLPNEIINTAIKENVDLIGVSSLAGAHLTLGTPLIKSAKDKDIPVVIGGVFPPMDEIRLKTIGYDAVFIPGTSGNKIIETIKMIVENRRI